jgi:hypothetical protein
VTASRCPTTKETDPVSGGTPVWVITPAASWMRTTPSGLRRKISQSPGTFNSACPTRVTVTDAVDGAAVDGGGAADEAELRLAANDVGRRPLCFSTPPRTSSVTTAGMSNSHHHDRLTRRLGPC